MRFAGLLGGALSPPPPGGSLSNPNRNWGANPERNKWVAGVTGYDGDFSNGAFAQWGQQHGYDANTLVNAYDRMQSSGGGWGQQPQMPQGGGWAGMSGLQGLLSGYAPMQPWGGGYGAGQFQPWGGSPAIHNGGAFGGNARSMGMDFGPGPLAPANSASSMLWTR